MDPDIALELARIAALYAYWTSKEASPPPQPDSATSPIVDLHKHKHVHQKQRYKRIIPLESESESDSAPSPMKRPKRKAAAEGMERIRTLNDFIRSQKVLLAPSVEVGATSDDESPPASQGSQGALQDYEVERVLDERWINGQREYLLKWEGDPLPTWEPATNVDNCEVLLKAFDTEADPGFEEDEEQFSDE